MTDPIDVAVIFGAIAIIVTTFFALSFLISSLWEHEKVAALRSVWLLIGLLALTTLYIYLVQIGIFHTGAGAMLLAVGIVVGVVAAILMVSRIGTNFRALQGTKGLIVGEVNRVDERDQVFARNRALRPESREYEEYYRAHPEHEEVDAKRRAVGGPLGQPGRIDSPNQGPNVAAIFASHNTPMHLSTPDKVKYPVDPEVNRFGLSPSQASLKVKGFTQAIGADLVGISELNPLWVYSHRGEIFNENWDDWGTEIAIDHKYVIVFATEMSFRLVQTAPHTSSSIATMHNYAKGAYISTRLAAYISYLGYSATAQHMRHFDLLTVPAAVDAGLGELGRHGYLITKEFGSRCRLAAVTTNLPLEPDEPVDLGVEDFCDYCKKCASCCPSRSISLGELEEVNGTRRWRFNAETCFDYWGKVG
ncbi:MAG: hypothetical protein MI702_14820, partial [Chlorobiales bacterium]|nr:hypothetical protein [Chlorobiales bacterium]